MLTDAIPSWSAGQCLIWRRIVGLSSQDEPCWRWVHFLRLIAHLSSKLSPLFVKLCTRLGIYLILIQPLLWRSLQGSTRTRRSLWWSFRLHTHPSFLTRSMQLPESVQN